MAIKIDLDGFWPGDKDDNYFVKLLRRRFDIVIDESYPDYIFYSCFYPNYDRNGVKIFFTGENVRVDFNRFDYGMGFDYLNFDDRYIRWPLYRVYDHIFENASSVENKYNPEKILSEKTGFCSFVHSSTRFHPIRELFFRRLSEYKKVDSGGKALNNIGGPVDNKLEFIKDYKFNIAFENSQAPGYTTEKLVEAMSANTIPIYWGNPVIDREFNADSFFVVESESDVDKIVSEIVRYDQNDELYLEKLSKPWITDLASHPSEDQLLDFFGNIFQQAHKDAFRVPEAFGFDSRFLDPEVIKKKDQERKVS